MKTWLTLLALILINPLFAQDKRGANWILGFNSFPAPDNSDGTLLSFKRDSLEIKYIEEGQYMSMGSANTGISDIDGNLLFYTNGCYISNALHDTLKNGENISPGFVELIFCDDGSSPLSQHQMIIPKPDSDHLFYIFQLNDVQGIPIDTIGGMTLAPAMLTYSVIDINEESGLGAVIEKNTELLRDTFSNNGLQMVKHANGRDWWLIAPVFASNCYYTFLITPTEIQLHEKQCVGKVWGNIDFGGQSIFSPNGKYYVRFHTRNSLNIFDFDRCKGHLMLSEEISFIQDTGRVVGVAISPNSRYLYAMVSDSAFQYDLWASDVTSSKILVAAYDGFSNPGPTRFRLAQLAPDGKIYIASNSNTFNLHVIEQPDSLGKACDFMQHKIELLTGNLFSIPIYPNYALTPLPGECDTLLIATTEPTRAPPISLYPNPAQEEVTIETEGSLQNARLQIADSQGHIIVATDEISTSRLYHLNTSGWSEGVYFVYIAGAEGWQWRRKVLVLRE